MARPRKQIDPRQVQRLAKLGCTQNEIGLVVGCSVDTLARRFADVLKKGYAELDTSIRRWQVTSARSGNVTMQIWLGKQFLGQRNEPSTAAQTDQLDELLAEWRKASARDPFDPKRDADP